MITTIGFDGDDTLWHTERFYALTERRCQRLLTAYCPADEVSRRLFDIEMRNLELYGYGAKSFALSMIETAIDVSGGRVTARELGQILQAGKAMISEPVTTLDHVAETVASLARSHRVMLITKGDLFDQQNKLAQSGLRDFFDEVVILSEKDPETYEETLRRHGLAASEFVMVGNSVRSDVLPVLALGAAAIHVPYEMTWAHEHATVDDDAHGSQFERVEAISDVPAAISRIVATRETHASEARAALDVRRG